MAISTASSWKQAIRKELTLPSGNVCLVRPISLDALLKGGKVPNSLLPMIKKAFAGKRMESKELTEVTEDQVVDMMRLFDVILCDCVLEPTVVPVPETPTNEDGTPGTPPERDPEALYADEVDMLDKQFIFQWAVGGTSDVEAFRVKSRELLDSLLPGASVEPETK